MKLVFFGSSIVTGAGASTPDRRFTTRVAQALGWDEINLGVEDSTVVGRDGEGLLTEYDSGLARVLDVLDARGDLILVLYGETDYAKHSPVGSPQRFQEGTFHSDYDTMMRGLLYVHRADQVVLCTIPLPSNADIEEYNDAIRSIGIRHGIAVIDPVGEGRMGAEDIQLPAGNSPSLNDRGHQLLAELMVQDLRKITAPK